MGNKRGFSLIEIIFVIAILAIVGSMIIPKNNLSKLDLATKKIITYLNYTRYIAHIDNKFDINDKEWEKKRWTLKFQNCSNSQDGIYFTIYSDTDGGTAHYKKSDCLKDPTTNKYLYTTYSCQPKADESQYTLLTKKFGVVKVEVSCNTTSTIGQISFGYDGKIYSSLGENIKQITSPCKITLFDRKGRSKTIQIEPNTGYIHKGEL